MSCFRVLEVLEIKYTNASFLLAAYQLFVPVCQFFMYELFGSAIKMTGLLCAAPYVFIAERILTV